MEAKARRQGVIKRSQVRVDEPGPRARAPAAAQGETADSGAPRVRLLRLDENTQALEVTCACGEVSLIEIRTEKKP